MTCGRGVAALLDRVGQRLELRRAARDQDERVAVVGEHVGERRADAGGGAGDDGDGFGGPAMRHGPANFAITSCGIGFGLDLLRVVGIALGPDAGVEAFDAKLAVEREAVLHVEARAAEFRDLGFDHHVVAELGRLEEARPGVHHRIALRTRSARVNWYLLMPSACENSAVVQVSNIAK